MEIKAVLALSPERLALAPAPFGSLTTDASAANLEKSLSREVRGCQYHNITL
jgi:hypothetical protein